MLIMFGPPELPFLLAVEDMEAEYQKQALAGAKPPSPTHLQRLAALLLGLMNSFKGGDEQAAVCASASDLGFFLKPCISLPGVTQVPKCVFRDKNDSLAGRSAGCAHFRLPAPDFYGCERLVGAQYLVGW